MNPAVIYLTLMGAVLLLLALGIVLWAVLESGSWREWFLPNRHKSGPPGRRR